MRRAGARARGPARRPDRRDGRPAARARAAQVAVDRRVDRLGAHPASRSTPATSTRPRRSTHARRGAQARSRPRARGPRAAAGPRESMDSGLLDRHIEFVEALRVAGLPVSLAEGLDAVRALGHLGLVDRETLRAAYAATLVKRPAHRPGFDQVFDLYFPALVGEGIVRGREHRSGRRNRCFRPRTTRPDRRTRGRSPTSGRRWRRRWRWATRTRWACWRARRSQRFGLIRGRGAGGAAVVVVQRAEPGLAAASWSTRCSPGCCAATPIRTPTTRRTTRSSRPQARAFEAAGRRGGTPPRRRGARARARRPAHRPAARSSSSTSPRARRPTSRRCAARSIRWPAGWPPGSPGAPRRARRGPLDFRRTVRASMSTGGVPMETRHKPKRPGRTDLVVLCDVSGSVANFAQLHADAGLRAARAVQPGAGVHVRRRDPRGHRPLPPGRRPGGHDGRPWRASAQHATLWGRTNYGRAFTRFAEQHADALTPKTEPARARRRALQLLRPRAAGRRRTWCTPPGTPGGSTRSTRGTGTPGTPRPASTAS